MTLVREKITSIDSLAVRLKRKLQFKKLNHLASYFVFTAILPLVYLPLILSNAPYSDTQSSLPELKFDTDSAQVVYAADPGNIIIPGESLQQKTEREQAEAAAAKAKARSRNTVAREQIRVYVDPSDFGPIYAAAEARFGVNAALLRAIHQVETGCSGSTDRVNKTGSGAQGPMQFLPSTWRRHAVDGNGDGIADINNVEDAIFTAAQYLVDCSYPNVRQALWGYNPSTYYYNKVLSIARELGYGG